VNEYDDADETPAQVWLQVQRQRAAERNFVTPAPLATRQPQTIDAVPQWVTQVQPFDVAGAWQPMAAAKEATSAVDRAKGLRIRLVPFLALYGLAGVVVGGAVWLVAESVPLAALGAVLTFAALGVGTYVKLNGQDYDHSGAGVERLRIVEAAQLQREQLEQTHELRKMALDAYLETLERHGGKR
jgi:hypothetical protein